ncbi:divergent polysaccharide deacetylase family protein [Affinirhizobium pseudoryzae]|uniref:divergent polysaccharide deacetylase family protein n=1 Tax=Allorhizobium pseudoryzae TaxID=379684 RepID=UPI0019D0C6F9|nr:divergent polysaccharide deacetylase family protein [Allorhizobium pseudoryzae]
MGTDLRAPLAPVKRNKGRPPRRPSSGVLLALLCGGAILGLSFYIIRAGQVEQASTTEVTLAVPPVPAQEPQPAAPNATADPSSSVSRSGAQAGANVEHMQMSDGSVVTKFSPKQRESDGPLIIDAQRVGQDPRLAATPNEALLEDSPYGRLPVRGPDGLRPMDQYARPWSGARGTRIAIVIGGLGLSQTGTQRAIQRLPDSVTLAFAASGNSLQRWMQEARRKGHELLVQVPMEPFDYPANNPGPLTLKVDAPQAENLKKLHEALGRITNYTGIVSYLGGRYMANADSLEPVMRDVADRGLLFLDDGSSAQSLTGKIGKAIGAPIGFGDLTVDSQLDRTQILKKLDDLERIAQRKGTAIGMGSAFDETVDAVADWIEEAERRGIEIVGVASLVSQPAEQ